MVFARFTLIGFLFLGVFPASAEVYSSKSGAQAEPGQAKDGVKAVWTNKTVQKSPPAERSISVRSSDCQALTRHVPSANVTYRPRQDDGGTPADLVAGPDFNDRARNFDLPIRVDLDRRLSVRADGTRRPVGAEGVIGVVEVRDGVAYFDGEPLGGDEVRIMREACLASIKPRKK